MGDAQHSLGNYDEAIELYNKSIEQLEKPEYIYHTFFLSLAKNGLAKSTEIVDSKEKSAEILMDAL